MRAKGISLWHLCKSELYKVRHNRNIIGTICFPILYFLLIFTYLLYKGREGLFDHEIGSFPGNPWLLIWVKQTLPILSLTFPIAIALQSHSICDIEYQNDNIRFLFSMPISRAKLYASKVLVLLLLIGTLCICAWGSFVFFGYMLGLFIPAYPFGSYAIFGPATLILSRILLASFCVGIFQLFLSLRFRNFSIPIFTCVFFSAASIFMLTEPYGMYFPLCTYTDMASSHTVEELASYSRRELANVVLLGIFLLIGYMSFTPNVANGGLKKKFDRAIKGR